MTSENMFSCVHSTPKLYQYGRVLHSELYDFCSQYLVQLTTADYRYHPQLCLVQLTTAEYRYYIVSCMTSVVNLHSKLHNYARR